MIGIESETSLVFRRFDADCALVVAALFLAVELFFFAAEARVTRAVDGTVGIEASSSPRPRYSDATDRTLACLANGLVCFCPDGGATADAARLLDGDALMAVNPITAGAGGDLLPEVDDDDAAFSVIDDLSASIAK